MHVSKGPKPNFYKMRNFEICIGIGFAPIKKYCPLCFMWLYIRRQRFSLCDISQLFSFCLSSCLFVFLLVCMFFWLSFFLSFLLSVPQIIRTNFYIKIEKWFFCFTILNGASPSYLWKADLKIPMLIKRKKTD